MDIEEIIARDRQVIKLIKYCVLDMLPDLDVLRTVDGVVVCTDSEFPPYTHWTRIRESIRDLRKVMGYHLTEDDHLIKDAPFTKMMEKVRQIDFFFTLPIDDPHVANIWAGTLMPQLKDTVIAIARGAEVRLKDLEASEQSCT